MNRAEFLNELDKRLRLIPQEDREDAIAYYAEYIDDSGLDENADVEALLGSPRDVASNIISECTVKHAEAQKETKSVRSAATTVWLVILGVASLPISLPLAIVAVVLVVTLAVVICAILLGLGIAGIVAVVGGFIRIGSAFFTGSFATGLVEAGRGLVILGGGVLVGIGTWKLGQLVIRLVSVIAAKRKAKGE